tara:strand:+ start:25019 stop:25618 length:600 start_codon:yes stop_codon:yes gene_type:complete
MSKIIRSSLTSEIVASQIQGHYSLLTNYYFAGGQATVSTITTAEVDTWLDVILTVDPLGTTDSRPEAMQLAQTNGHEGDGSLGSPIKFLLEGLDTTGSCSLRASLSFNPDEDGGRLDSRIFIERHSAASPSVDFPINAAGLAMESGADEEYPHLVTVQFFIGDTINTNGVDDAGKIRFQIKSDVAGTVSMNEMALFIQS